MNLATPYLGLNLRSPFVVGASPFCDDVYAARKLQDAGAGAVVMRSLFAEQLLSLPRARSISSGDMAPDFPEYADYQLSPDLYLFQIEQLKTELTIPVIASLNGHRPGVWMDFAPKLEDAGADAIELNFYQIVTDPCLGADDVEAEMLKIVGEVASSVDIPVSVKLSPYHASVAQLAVALEIAGSAGTVIFNRFYQPDLNIDDLEVRPTLRLSDSSELLLRLRWLAILSPLVRGSLAAGGGIHTATDTVKVLLTGAHVAQVVSVVVRHGPNVLLTLRRGLEGWMNEHNFTQLEDFRGLLNLRRCRDASNYERANYIRSLQSWKM